MKIKAGRYTIEITHGDKILFGKSGITKEDLAHYYQTVASIMLPYVNNRPISMQRFPQGIDSEGFFQKDAGDYFPDFVIRFTVKKQHDGVVHYVVIDKVATLIYLANQNCITPHIWLSKIDDINRPDRMIFDLDPADGLGFTAIQKVAQIIKKKLDMLNIPAFCMLTGSRGAHIVVPLRRIHTFDEVREFAHTIAQQCAQQFPDLITVDVSKSKRGKRVFIDWLRNSFGATAVAPYAVRPLVGAPVAMPVTWQELLSPKMSSQRYTIANALRHVKTVGDAWQSMNRYAVSLKNKGEFV